MKPIALLRRAFWGVILRFDRRHLPRMTIAQRLRAAQLAVRAFRNGGGSLSLRRGIIGYQDAPTEDAVTVVALLRTEVREILRAERNRC